MTQNKKSPEQAIDTQVGLNTTDVSQQIDRIIAEFKQFVPEFIPDKLISRSDYFGTGKIGAFHYVGIYQEKQAVLKIQAARPQVSEAQMIEQFSAQNKSQLIRAPQVFAVFPWNKNNSFEAIIMEQITGPKVIPSGQLLSEKQIQDFFKVYQEYRSYCLNKPWLSLPQQKEDLIQRHLTNSKKIKPDSPYRESSDQELANQANSVLRQAWQGVEPEFQHSHFSAEDLIWQGKKVILLSNLFWKWRYPYYDAVFGYHWFIYTLASIPNITPKQIEAQRQLWLDAIYQLIQTPEQRKLLTAALLERAVAGLLVDSVAYIDEDNPVAEYLVQATRKEVVRLIEELKG